jgi:hypothetical protein
MVCVAAAAAAEDDAAATDALMSTPAAFSVWAAAALASLGTPSSLITRFPCVLNQY